MCYHLCKVEADGLCSSIVRFDILYKYQTASGRARQPSRQPISPDAETGKRKEEKGGRERRKIEIKVIGDKSRRHITFPKRKAGIMKKDGVLLK